MELTGYITWGRIHGKLRGYMPSVNRHTSAPQLGFCFADEEETRRIRYSSQRNYRVLHNYRDAVQSSRKVNDYKTEISQSRANVCTPITEKTTRGSLRCNEHKRSENDRQSSDPISRRASGGLEELDSSEPSIFLRMEAQRCIPEGCRTLLQLIPVFILLQTCPI